MKLNWDEMSPRERDAYVAIEVMKYKIIDYGEEALYFKSPDKFCGPNCFNHEHILPYYTTDIKAAWEIVEVFAKKDGHHSPAITSAYLGSEEEKGWCVSLGNVHSVYGLTAPEAISLAALRAVGVEV